MTDQKPNPKLAKFSDSELQYELHTRHVIRERERMKGGVCCYCSQPITTKEQICKENPFDSNHVWNK